MLRLNLLPWRERQRQAALRRLRVTLVGSLAVGLCAVLLVDQLARQRVQAQRLANDSRQADLGRLDARMAAHEPIRLAHEAVVAQVQVLANLRVDQGREVAIFRDLERALPEGVQLLAIKRQGASLHITGLAASGAVVAQFMRDLERSGVLSELELRRVRSLPGGDEFQLMARLSASWS